LIGNLQHKRMEIEFMKTLMRLCSVLTAIAVLIFVGSVSAQDQGSTGKFGDKHNVTDSESTLKFRSDLVVIDVSVLDKNRNFVSGLDKTSFRIFDEQAEQQIDLFSSESVPISLGFLIDTSGSMKFKLKTVIESAKQMLDMCRHGDEVFVVDMKDTLRIKYTQPFTKNIGDARAAFDDMYPSGGTALPGGISSSRKYSQENSSQPKRALLMMNRGDEPQKM